VCGNCPKTGDTYCVPSPDKPSTPNALSMDVEWSGSVTEAGSTRRGYGLASAAEVLQGILIIITLFA